MRGRGWALAVVLTGLLCATVVGALLTGREQPVRLDLGPAVLIHLDDPSSDVLPGERRQGRRAVDDSTARDRAEYTPPQTSGVPPSGASTVPRHDPAPAGQDDDDDHDDDDDGTDDEDDDDDDDRSDRPEPDDDD